MPRERTGEKLHGRESAPVCDSVIEIRASFNCIIAFLHVHVNYTLPLRQNQVLTAIHSGSIMNLITICHTPSLWSLL
jgi:hypothetical protein